MPSKRTPASLAEILFVIGEVENSKQIHLSEAERAALQYDLYKLQKTLPELVKYAEAVKRSNTYGKLSLDVWLTCESLYTEEEIAQMVENCIRKRREQFLRLRMPSEEELAREGLISVQEYWAGELRRQIEKHAERIDKKCRRLRAQFFHLDEQAKKDLWQKAVQKGLVKDGDEFAHLILPQLVPMMMEDFESAIKNSSAGGTTGAVKRNGR